MVFSVIEVESTPNPNARKFVLNGVVSEQPTSFFEASAAVSHPLASRLFSVRGVQSVLLLNDFVTINKSPEGRWSEITTAVKRILQDPQPVETT